MPLAPRCPAIVLAAIILSFVAASAAQRSSAPSFDLERLAEETGVSFGLMGHSEHAPLVVLDSQNKGAGCEHNRRVEFVSSAPETR